MGVLTVKKVREPYYHGFAAQMSFFYVIALVPLLMLIVQVLTATKLLPVDSVLALADEYITVDLPDIVTSLLNPKLQMTTNVVVLAMALWAASRAQFAMTRIANYTFTDGRTTGRGFVRERLRAYFTMFITLVAVCCALAVLVYGKQIFYLMIGFIDKDYDPHISIPFIWNILRWLVGFVIFACVITCNYYVMPTEKLKLRKIVPGSLFAAFAVMVITWAFSIYIGKIADYDIVYGSLASIVALLMWFYFVAWGLCLGLIFAKVLDDTRPGRYDIQASEK